MTTPQKDPASDRPDFAVSLGLLPPYTLEDIKRAYLAKVKTAHPDHGGDRAAFDKLQNAFEQANAYVSFRGDRRQWIAARMEEYVAVIELVERLRQVGAEVDTSIVDWVKHSFGDFANLTESVIGIKYQNAANVSELVDTMVRERKVLSGLKRLDLSGSAVTDAIALQLRVFHSLTHLDLRRTQITDRALVLADWLTQLESLETEGTSIGWWARRKANRKLGQRARPQLADVIQAVNRA